MVGPVISVFAMFNTPSLVAVAQNVKPCPLFCASRSLATLQTRERACLTSFSIRDGVFTTSGVTSTVSIGLASEASASQRSKGTIF
jgi:hypothetical protein